MPLSLNALLNVPTRDEKLRKWEVEQEFQHAKTLREMSDTATMARLDRGPALAGQEVEATGQARLKLQDAEDARAARDLAETEDYRGDLAKAMSAVRQASAGGALKALSENQRTLGGMPLQRTLGRVGAEASIQDALTSKAVGMDKEGEAQGRGLAASERGALSSQAEMADSDARIEDAHVRKEGALGKQPKARRLGEAQTDAQLSTAEADNELAMNEIARARAMAPFAAPLAKQKASREMALSSTDQLANELALRELERMLTTEKFNQNLKYLRDIGNSPLGLSRLYGGRPLGQADVDMEILQSRGLTKPGTKKAGEDIDWDHIPLKFD